MITSPVNGSVTANSVFELVAQASDPSPGTGVQRVEFHAAYDGQWHPACTATTAPYTCTWDGSTVADQHILFTIHVIDRAGNRTLDPGGYRLVQLQRTPPPSSTPMPTDPARGSYLYDDHLGAGWENWSWDTDVNLATSQPVYEGTQAIRAHYASAWGGVYLHHAGVALTGFSSLEFAIHGGVTGGQRLQLVAKDTRGTVLPTVLLTPYLPNGTVAANTWHILRVPLADLGLGGYPFTGIILQDASGGVQPAVYLDSIRLR